MGLNVTMLPKTQTYNQSYAADGVPKALPAGLPGGNTQPQHRHAHQHRQADILRDVQTGAPRWSQVRRASSRIARRGKPSA